MMIAATSRLHRAAGALLLWAAACASRAESDEGLWSTATVGAAINNQWRASVAVQQRLFDGTGSLDRHLIRPSVTRLLGDGRSVTLGYGAHFVDEPTGFVEQRLWQQYQQSWPLHKLRIDLRLRIEERVFENRDGVNVRPRLLAGFRYPLGDSSVFAIARDEVIFNVNSLDGGPEDGYEQNRLFLGVGGRLTGKLSGELGYQLVHVNRPGLSALSVHTLFISLTASLN